VRHHRDDHGAVAFDPVQIDAHFTFDSDPMPVLVVVDVLGGNLTYTRDRQTDLSHDGDTVLVAGWDMPFAGHSDGYDVRATSISSDLLAAAVREMDPDHPRTQVHFTSYVPHSAAAGARWRATIDQLSAAFPDQASVLAHGEAKRLLGHTLLHTFPNDVVDDASPRSRDLRDATPSAVRRAARIIEERAEEDLALADLAGECAVTPRTLQYAFRKEMGCTPHDYLRRVRLDLVRQALRDGSAATVGEAAARFGFFNAGRFAAEYREVFQENPRQTLLRATS
jgi:AraC-like DNA-binding protein